MARVELLWWEGCPSTPEAEALLRAALSAIGADPDAAELVELHTEDDARAAGFPGSPTFRVGGRDLFPVDEPAGLTCRVYRLRDGRAAPVPDPDDLRAALEAALTPRSDIP